MAGILITTNELHSERFGTVFICKEDYDRFNELVADELSIRNYALKKTLDENLSPVMASYYYLAKRIDANKLPDSLEVTSPDSIGDLNRWFFNLHIVSEKMKSIIESVEDENQQFIDVDLLDSSGNHLGRYCFWKICNVVDAIKYESDGIEVNSGAYELPNPADGTHTFAVNDGIKLVDKTQVSMMAAWFDIRMNADIFVSQELIIKMKSAGINNYQISYFFNE
ncbi:imm11 family protein [Enterovibrio norvegicus]|uniref:imm11 family protein n=1 Tax=Enterovibrio norvegicus TaxID=188144 RepID=UPI00354E5F7F